jgi:hypothetical protein
MKQGLWSIDSVMVHKELCRLYISPLLPHVPRCDLSDWSYSVASSCGRVEERQRYALCVVTQNPRFGQHYRAALQSSTTLLADLKTAREFAAAMLTHSESAYPVRRVRTWLLPQNPLPVPSSDGRWVEVVGPSPSRKPRLRRPMVQAQREKALVSSRSKTTSSTRPCAKLVRGHSTCSAGTREPGLAADQDWKSDQPLAASRDLRYSGTAAAEPTAAGLPPLRAARAAGTSAPLGRVRVLDKTAF